MLSSTVYVEVFLLIFYPSDVDEATNTHIELCQYFYRFIKAKTIFLCVSLYLKLCLSN